MTGEESGPDDGSCVERWLEDPDVELPPNVPAAKKMKRPPGGRRPLVIAIILMGLVAGFPSYGYVTRDSDAAGPEPAASESATPAATPSPVQSAEQTEPVRPGITDTPQPGPSTSDGEATSPPTPRPSSTPLPVGRAEPRVYLEVSEDQALAKGLDFPALVDLTINIAGRYCNTKATDVKGMFTLDVTSCVKRAKKRVAVVEALLNGDVLDSADKDVGELLGISLPPIL